MNKIRKNEIFDKFGELFKAYYPPEQYQFEKPILRFSNDTNMIWIATDWESSEAIRFKICLIKNNPSISQKKKIIFPEIPSSLVLLQLQASVNDIEEFGYNQKIQYWDIREAKDCDRVYTDHFNFMESIGNEFLNRYSTLEGIHKYINIKFLNEFDLNSDQNHYKRIKHFFQDRELLTGLIAAYLLGYDEVDNLIYLYKKLHNHINMHKLIDRVKDYFEKNIVTTKEKLLADTNYKLLTSDEKENKNIVEVEENDIEEIESTSDAVSLYLKGGNEEKVLEWLRKDRIEIGEFCILLEETYRDEGEELDFDEIQPFLNRI